MHFSFPPLPSYVILPDLITIIKWFFMMLNGRDVEI